MAEDRSVGGAPAFDLLVAVLLALVVASTFAPWLRSGASRRTSYEVVRAADRLDVLGPSAQALANVVWSAVPAVAAISVFALVRERRMIAAVAGLLVGLVVAAFALVVKQAPDAADWGVTVGLASACALLAGSGAMAVYERRSGR